MCLLTGIDARVRYGLGQAADRPIVGRHPGVSPASFGGVVDLGVPEVAMVTPSASSYFTNTCRSTALWTMGATSRLVIVRLPS